MNQIRIELHIKNFRGQLCFSDFFAFLVIKIDIWHIICLAYCIKIEWVLFDNNFKKEKRENGDISF